MRYHSAVAFFIEIYGKLMSVEFVFRLLGMVVFALIGAQSHRLFDSGSMAQSARLIIVVTLAGAGLGLLIGPYLTIYPFRWLQRKLKELSASKMLSGVIGLAVGLAIAALAYPPLSNLPDPYGSVLPVTASIFFGYVGAGLPAFLFSLICRIAIAPGMKDLF